MIVKVQSSRISKLKRAIRRALKERYIKARSLVKIAGQCVSTAWAGTPGKLLLRNIYRLLSKRDSWARGTLCSYNVLLELYDYCRDNDIHFPPMKSAGLANFLVCHIK